MTTDIKAPLKDANLERENLVNDIERLENEYFNLNQVEIRDNKTNLNKRIWLETVRPALLKYWKFKTSLFPLIYYSKQRLKFLNEAKETTKEETFLGPFPIEIWKIIMQKGCARMEVPSINKCFHKELAPYAYCGVGYENLQLLLVVSSTHKMRQNDACFLREGPDFPDKPCDSYSIYERNLESFNFEYEFLDVDYDVPKSIRDEIAGAKADKKTLVITDYEEIKHLVYHVLNNPDSMKHWKSINIDISILHGYKELIYDSEIYTVLEYYGRSLGNGSLSSKTQVKADDFFYGPDSHQLFHNREGRWGAPKLGLSKNFDAHSFSKIPYNTANEIFPNKVYFNELIHLSELFKSYESGQRSELLKISTDRELRMNHPYKKYVLSLDQITQSPEFNGPQFKIDGAIASHNIKIRNRRFASENEVTSLIKLMVGLLSSNKLFKDTDTSLFISGMTDFQETKDILKSQTGKYRPVTNMYKYKPHLTLLNKPKSV
ncbi:hypothetical protein BN7_3265 [Wickerhamomyces ciferrii]|uniref:Uncharacterized protein n=1 Tax=Wickerhamomyces ciferrii (strain ATCC 14091 / BCRC 22168 / CBS 111 / JCM 3599 / NBRC 0793 / NRRL Y-1031 F-60-10) TaxID=1206466 RepID=K0KL39_WICCF|nr:uncharacterized protein BN7_3265 [Wickerhamomyces ciferrii]CCH43711.1 hypothetical protein BN7_3265 [Wickerhamomyces ciferrii]